MRHLGYDQFSIVGHDRGARCAYRLALDHPDSVLRLAVMDVVPVGDAGDWQSGTDPERRDYASLADFADPDGNTWVIPEIGFHPANTAIGDAEAQTRSR